jgi:polyhydroxyalkanoate synthase
MGMNLPNPADMAKTYAEVAQRASRLITQFMEKKAKDGVDAPTDELGVAKAFMDMSSRLMANPYKMAQTQMNMMWDYFSLWQGSIDEDDGPAGASPGRLPEKGRQPLQGRGVGRALHVRLHQAVLPDRRPPHA